MSKDQTTAERVAAISRWVDEHNADKSAGHLLRVRIGKLNEEMGEVEELLVELENSNPRKTNERDPDHVRDRLRIELLDVALTALGAFEHLSENQGASVGWLHGHVRRVHERIES